MTGVDASQLAVDQATANARLNGLDGTVKFICEDVFELLPELEEDVYKRQVKDSGYQRAGGKGGIKQGDH